MYKNKEIPNMYPNRDNTQYKNNLLPLIAGNFQMSPLEALQECEALKR